MYKRRETATVWDNAAVIKSAKYITCKRETSIRSGSCGKYPEINSGDSNVEEGGKNGQRRQGRKVEVLISAKIKCNYLYLLDLIFSFSSLLFFTSLERWSSCTQWGEGLAYTSQWVMY